MGIRIAAWLTIVVLLGVPTAFAQDASDRAVQQRVQQLTKTLVVGSASHRAAAAVQLSALGADARPALPELYAALYDLDANVRLHSVQAVGRLSASPVESINRLLPVLSDPDEHVRYAAEWVIAKLAVQPVSSQDVPRMMDTLQQAINIVSSREHHIGHRQVMQQALQSLSASRAPAVEVAPLPSAVPPPVVEEIPLPESANLEIQQLQTLAAAYEVGDLLEHLRIIEQLASKSGLSAAAESKLTEIRQAILKQSILQSELLSTRYAVHRWPEDSAVLLANIFQELPSQRLPVWSVGVLDELTPANLAQIEKLTAIVASHHNAPPIRAAAALALGRSRTEIRAAMEALRRPIPDSSEDLFFRASCITALGTLARHHPAEAEAVRELEHLLSNPQEDWMLVSKAAAALAAADSRSREVARRFVEAAQARDLADHQLPTVFETLASLGPAADAVLPLIDRGLSAEDEWIRESAATAVVPLGSTARALAPELMNILRDREELPAVRAAVARAVVAIGPETIAHFGQELRYADQPLQQQGLTALSSLGPDALPALEACIELLQNSDSERTRAAAALTIGCIGKDATAAGGILDDIVSSGNSPQLCATSIIALSQIGQWRPGQTTPASSVAQSPAVRAAVAYADHLSTQSSGVPQLMRQLTEDDSAYAAQALLDLGQPAIDALQQLVRNKAAPPQHRVLAVETLVRISPIQQACLVDMLDDAFIGDACLAGLAEQEPEEPWLHLQELVQTFDAVEDIAARQRVAHIIQLWAEGTGSGLGDTPVAFGSHLGNSLVEEIVPVSFSQARSIPNSPLIGPSLPSPRTPAGNFPPFKFGGLGQGAANAIFGNEEITGSVPEEAPADVAEAAPATPQTLAALAAPLRPSEIAVFYGTNRAATRVQASRQGPWTHLTPALIAMGCACCVICVWVLRYSRRRLVLASMLTVATIGSTVAWLSLQHRESLNAGPSQNVEYGGTPSQHLTLGRCLVSIPSNHRRGELEMPSIFRLEFKRDPEKHVYLQTTTELDETEFNRQLKSVMHELGDELLVFIHGYNVSFEEAALRTAQLAYDLDFEGAPVFYSWPSQDNWHQYQLDRKNIELSVPHIQQFLVQLAEQSGAERIHLIAHSMGNVGLTQALAEMQTNANHPRFNQVVLAAPDIDADIFKLRIAPRIVDKAERCTLYTSKNDLALIASHYFNSGPRLGETLIEDGTYPGLDVIDASAVDTSLLGHSYYGNATLISDIRELLHDRAVEQRRLVRLARGDGHPRWFLEARVLPDDGPIESAQSTNPELR